MREIEITPASLDLDHDIEVLMEQRPFGHFTPASLDAMIGGAMPSRLVIVGAQPGAGKTTFVDQIKTDLAAQGVPAFFACDRDLPLAVQKRSNHGCEQRSEDRLRGIVPS